MIKAIMQGLWRRLVLAPGVVMLLVALPLLAAPAVQAADESLNVMKSFTEQERQVGEEVFISDKKKHLILFTMGIALLVGILTTAGLGLAMVLFGKEVFLAHMICAGLSVFLSIAHAVTAMVWFFPF